MSPERLNGGETSALGTCGRLGHALFAVEGYDAFERETITATMLAVMNERVEFGGTRRADPGVARAGIGRRLDAVGAGADRAAQNDGPSRRDSRQARYRVDIKAAAGEVDGRLAIGAPVVILASWCPFSCR